MIAINRNNEKAWRQVALYGTLSINLGLMIMGGYFIGELLEDHYQLSNMSLTGVLLGLFLGLYQMFSMAFRAGKNRD